MNEEPQALTVREPAPLPVQQQADPAQARNLSVAHTLDAAYAKASTLQLTPEERQALMADFPDDAVRSGARGDANLLYIEHAYVRQRLMEVFGPGQWAIINRRSWLDENAGWLYADTVLLCRGCFVGECVGAMRYSARNARTNYADAIKGAESDALGRIAGTALGVGLQLWKAGWCEGWKERRRNGTQTRSESSPAQRQPEAIKTPPRANSGPKQASPEDLLPKKATEKTRTRMLELLCAEHGDDKVIAYCRMMNECTPDMWPLDRVPTDAVAMTRLKQAVGDWWRSKEREEAAENATNPVDTQVDELPADIAAAIITLPRAGMKRTEYLKNPDTIGSLYAAASQGDDDEAHRLFGCANSWEVGPREYNGKTYPPSPEDVESRAWLDKFLVWHEAKEKRNPTPAEQLDFTP